VTPLVIAHSGASVAHPENTVEAFVAAGRMGADMVELDVRRTADGLLAVHHDARLTDGRLVVELPAGGLPGHVPLLDAAIAACEGMTVNVEIKNFPGDPDFDESELVATRVAELVAAGRLHDRVLVSSFNLHAIDHVRGMDAEIPTAWLVSPPVVIDEVLDRLEAHGHRVLHPHDITVTDALVAAAHERGVAVNTWTVDDPARMLALAAMGIDGICTNVPDIARDVLDRA
jgi:glycerophosphoryl diester phosphodiesterase